MDMASFRKKYNFSQSETAKVLGFQSSRGIRAIEKGERDLLGPTQKAMEYYIEVSQLQEQLEDLHHDMEALQAKLDKLEDLSD